MTIFDIQSMPSLDHPFHVLNFISNCTSLKSLLVCGAILAETIRVLNDSLYIIEMYLGTIESSKEVDQRSTCTNRSNRRQERVKSSCDSGTQNAVNDVSTKSFAI